MKELGRQQAEVIQHLEEISQQEGTMLARVAKLRAKDEEVESAWEEEARIARQSDAPSHH